MRWYKPRVGDRKKKRRFLLFPMTINHECRWLERAVIEYEYKAVTMLGPSGFFHKQTWVPVAFCSAEK